MPFFDAPGRPVLSGAIYDPASGRNTTAGTLDRRTGLVATSTGFVRDPLPGNAIPASRFNPVGSAMVTFYPNPTNAGLADNFTAASTADAHSTEYLIRVDHNLTEATRLFGRWAQKSESKVNYPAFYGANDVGGPGNIARQPLKLRPWRTHVFTPTLAASADVGYSRWAEGGIGQSYPFDQTKLGLPGILNAASPRFPLVNVSGQVPLGPSQGGQGTGFRNVGSVYVDLTKTAGAHSLSFGFMNALMQNNGNTIPQTNFSVDQNFTAGPDPTGTDARTGFGFASLLFGTAASGSTANNFNPALTKRYFSFYVEDDWKAFKSLTPNLGLRYEWQGAPTERFDRQA